MPRPTIFDRPMTAAERMRRWRAARQNGATPPDRITSKQRAGVMRRSVRQFYLIQEFDRFATFTWHPDILNNKHGRCGMRFLALVCRFGTPAEQRRIHDIIRRKGAAAGRALWRDILSKRREAEGRATIDRFNAAIRARTGSWALAQPPGAHALNLPDPSPGMPRRPNAWATFRRASFPPDDRGRERMPNIFP